MRAVLDTGVVLSALVFPSRQLDWIVDAWQGSLLKPLVSSQTSAELIRALTYPKFQLDEDEIQILLASYLPHAEAVTVDSARLPDLPRCRDEGDQIFLELAAAGGAEALVTGDHALLKLADRTPFRVLSPAELRESLR